MADEWIFNRIKDNTPYRRDGYRTDWTEARVGRLPDTAFLHIEQDGTRHLPYRDEGGKVHLSHLNLALGRLGREKTQNDGWLTPELRDSLIARSQSILDGQD